MRRIAVRGVIIKDGMLFAQRLHKEGSVYDYWCTPGGGLDDNESLEDGLRREMIEETGVEPEIGKLLMVQQYADDKMENLEFFFHITNADDYETINLYSTSHGVAEIAECRFVDPAIERIMPNVFNDHSLAELTQSSGVKLFSEL